MRPAQAQEAARVEAELRLRSSALRQGLPRPATLAGVAGAAPAVDGPSVPPRERAERLLAQEMEALLQHDAAKYPLKVRA